MCADHRKLTPQQRAIAKDILRHGRVGYLSVAGDGPYVVPINFALDDPADSPEQWGRILFHTGPGRKTRALETDPRVCMAVVTDAEFRKGDLPCDDSYAFRSVLVEGTAALLTGRAEREQALRTIVVKYDPGAGEEPFDEQIFQQTLLFSVSIETVSFKQKPRRS